MIERVRALALTDLRVALRDNEQLLLTLGIPVALLVFFSTVDVLPTGTGEPVDYLAPGIVALALLSGAFVRLAISLGFDRGFGAIKRFGITPLGPGEFLAAKGLVAVVLFAVQLVFLGVVAALLGWRPSLHIGALAAIVLGLLTFVGLAFVVSGLVDGLRSLAISNALFIVLLLVSGIVFELDRLPGWLLAVVKLLPSTALAELLRNTFDGAVGPRWAWLTLLAWAVATPALGLKLFRWSPN